MSTELAELNEVLSRLTTDQVKSVLDYARLFERQNRLPIDESSEWTEEDLREWGIDSLRHFEAEHGEEDWGGLIENCPEPTL
jgi:hypothetical protein